jgi:hypothetical protein
MMRKSKIFFVASLAILVFIGCTEKLNSSEKGLPSAILYWQGDIHGYYSGNPDVTVERILDCQMVFWHNGHGSSMTHYPGCDNPIHLKQRDVQQ